HVRKHTKRADDPAFHVPKGRRLDFGLERLSVLATHRQHIRLFLTGETALIAFQAGGPLFGREKQFVNRSADHLLTGIAGKFPQESVYIPPHVPPRGDKSPSRKPFDDVPDPLFALGWGGSPPPLGT